MPKKADNLDRRIKRTHRLLGDALIELTLAHGYDNVSIRDITEHADIAYATFFRHYKDKNELLQETLQDLIEETEQLAQMSEKVYNEGYGIFQHAQLRSDLYRVLLMSQGAHQIINDLIQFIANDLISTCTGYFKKSLAHIPPEIIAHQVASSILQLVKWWLENDMPYPPEEMAKYYHDVVVVPYFEDESRPIWDSSGSLWMQEQANLAEIK